MTKSISLKILFTIIASFAIACPPKLAFAQRGGGGHGGGGGGFYGGGGGFRGGGSGVHGFQGGSGGFRGGPPAGFSRGGGGANRSGGFSGGPRNFSFPANPGFGAYRPARGFVDRMGVGRLGVGPPSSAHFGPSSMSSRNFGRGVAAPTAARGFANADGHWHSFASPSAHAGINPGARGNSPGSTTIRNFGNPASASSARGLMNAADGWRSFGHAADARDGASAPAMASNPHSPSLTVDSNRSQINGASPRSWSGQGHSMWSTSPRSGTLGGSSAHALSNIGTGRFHSSGFNNSLFASSRFGNSAFGRSRFGVNTSLFGGSRFGANGSLLAGSRFGRNGFRSGLFNRFGHFGFGDRDFDDFRFGRFGFGGGCWGCGFGWGGGWGFGLGFNWGWGGGWGAYPDWGVGYYNPWWGWPDYGYYAPPAVNDNVTYPAPYSSSDSTDSSSTYYNQPYSKFAPEPNRHNGGLPSTTSPNGSDKGRQEQHNTAPATTPDPPAAPTL